MNKTGKAPMNEISLSLSLSQAFEAIFNRSLVSEDCGFRIAFRTSENRSKYEVLLVGLFLFFSLFFSSCTIVGFRTHDDRTSNFV